MKVSTKIYGILVFVAFCLAACKPVPENKSPAEVASTVCECLEDVPPGRSIDQMEKYVIACQEKGFSKLDQSYYLSVEDSIQKELWKQCASIFQLQNEIANVKSGLDTSIHEIDSLDLAEIVNAHLSNRIDLKGYHFVIKGKNMIEYQGDKEISRSTVSWDSVSEFTSTLEAKFDSSLPFKVGTRFRIKYLSVNKNEVVLAVHIGKTRLVNKFFRVQE